MGPENEGEGSLPAGTWALEYQQGLAAALKTCFFCSTRTRSSLKFRSVYVEDGRKSWWGNGQCV